LAQQKESRIEEGHLLADHVHMLISIPPKYAVSQVVGFIKGKSAIHLARVYGEKKHNFVGQHFWARGYCAQYPGAGINRPLMVFWTSDSSFYQCISSRRVGAPAPSGFALPKPYGNFRSFRANAWNYSLLESEVTGADVNIIESIRTDGRAPTFLKQAL
jgi:hypothetical protein